MGVHTSVDTLGTCTRHLLMASMCSTPQNAHILMAQTPLSKNSATFLKTIFLGHPVYEAFVIFYQTNI